MLWMAEVTLQQLLSTWSSLDLRRQIIVLVSTGAVFFGVLTMARIATAPTLSLLYAGLENGAAGDVVRSLEQRGVAYEVRGGSIFVDSQQRDELRLTLASEGLPANSTQGYELLDGLSGFGTTSQMFDAAYWRAKEGELARTIVASPNITFARVHIASTATAPFQRGATPKASVQITPNGSGLSAQHAKAVRFLIASAVSGLEPDEVAVIDSNGTLIGASEDAPIAGDNEKATVLKERAQRLLEARVGLGNAIVEVDVETETESEQIRERRFDPETRIAISTDTEERTNNSNEAGGGDVTVASNLPDNEGGAGGSTSSQNSETRERINYEVSETEREVRRAPGALKRLTVAVLVNDEQVVNADGAVDSTPRSDEELASLRDLVASAVGFSEERGDIITIKSMQLQTVPPVGTDAPTSFMDGVHLDVMAIIQMAVLALVTIILSLFVIRPLLMKAPAPIRDDMSPRSDSMDEEPSSGDLPALPALNGEVSDSDLSPGGLDLSSEFGGLPELPSFGGLSNSDDPADRLRNMIGDRQEESVQILRSWLEEDRKEKA